MIKASALNILALNKIKDFVKLQNIVLIYREAQPHALPRGDAIPDAAHRGVIRAVMPAKIIIDIGQPVKRDTDIGDAGLLYPSRGLLGDERAVGRERRPDAALARV